MNHESSDPLPYTQVDRAAKPKAAQLAGALGVTPQHALGSLIEFWDLCGEVRELERLIAEGKEEVVLARSEVARRFRLASGREVDPDDLTSVGLLEQRGENFRVRGMSRFFVPIKARLQRRDAARNAGLASAKARAQRHGSAQPMASKAVSAPFEERSNEGSTPVRTPAEPATERPPNVEATEIQPSGHRTSDSVELLKATTAPEVVETGPLIVEPPDSPPDTWLGEDFWRWAQAKRQAAGFVAERRRPHPRALSAWYSTALATLETDVERLMEAFYRFGENQYWQQQTPALPFAGFMAQWDKFVPRRLHVAP